MGRGFGIILPSSHKDKKQKKDMKQTFFKGTVMGSMILSFVLCANVASATNVREGDLLGIPSSDSRTLQTSTEKNKGKTSMKGYDKIADIPGLKDQILKWHEDLHRKPETALREVNTSRYIATELKEMGYEVHEGVGKTGVVAVLKVGDGKKSIGLRADFDALPIQEVNDLPYKSEIDGCAHLCGHDSHTAMLLGAAKYLIETKNFSGTLNLIFQPAEETMEGGDAMIQDGLFDRFRMDAIYGMHNGPSLPLGKFLFGKGNMMASVDNWEIVFTGKGGHGSAPENTIDPVVAGSSFVMALQTIVSRNVSPLDKCVVSVGAFNSGNAANVIPETAVLRLSIRNMEPKTREMVLAKVRHIAETQAGSFGCKVEIIESHPGAVLTNDDKCTDYVIDVAKRTFGAENVLISDHPSMGSEDFAFMLREKPGSYFFIGNGVDSHSLHHPEYVTNQEILPIGANMWVALVEDYLKK